jgi:hypothetical protein
MINKMMPCIAVLTIVFGQACSKRSEKEILASEANK